MTDDQTMGERRQSPWGWVTSLHTLIGVLAGSATTLAAVLAFGGRILNAPTVAAQALAVANAASAQASANRTEVMGIDHDFRLVFCTDDQFHLSQASRIELRCYELTTPRRHAP